MHISPGANPAGAGVAWPIIHLILFQSCPARWRAGRIRVGPTGPRSKIRMVSKWRAGEVKMTGFMTRELYLHYMKDEIKWIIIIKPVIYVFVCWKVYIYVSGCLIYALYSCGFTTCLVSKASYVRYSRGSPVGPAKYNIYPNPYYMQYLRRGKKTRSLPRRGEASEKGGGPIGLIRKTI